MSKHVTISPTEAANRLAIRELVEAYAHCADRRDAIGQSNGGRHWNVEQVGLARERTGEVVLQLRRARTGALDDLQD